MADETLPEGGDAKKKKSGLIVTVGVVAALSLVGAGGGWVLGGMIGPQILPAGERPPPADKAKPEEKAEVDYSKPKKEDEGLEHIATEANGVVQLEPITTNLAFPADRWIRLEVALLFKDKPDISTAEDIHQDIAAYLRTVTLQQIDGPRGFLYLKEDLEDRADLISEGKVKRILFRTFVIE